MSDTKSQTPDDISEMFELFEAVDKMLISYAMGRDLDVAIERLRAAKERIDNRWKEDDDSGYN